MAVSIRITHNLPQVQRLFRAIRQFSGDAKPLMDRIAAEGETQTRIRFRDQVAPDGSRWKPSLRAKLAGGQTLTRDGHLGDSINGYGTADEAVWGVNRIYAAIHQFGGTIRAKGSRGLRFAIPGLGWRTVAQVSIPARPFLGLSDDDRRNILDLVQAHLSSLMRRNAPGGA